MLGGRPGSSGSLRPCLEQGQTSSAALAIWQAALLLETRPGKRPVVQTACAPC